MRIILYKKLIISVLILFMLIPISKAQATWELGAKAGTAFYMGDGNSTIFNGIDPVYGGLVRINANCRWATKVEFATGIIKTDIAINQSYVDFSIQEEFNFFEYGLLNSDKWTRFFSPYVFAGLGLGSYSKGDYVVFSPNIPFGIGVKYKVLSKVNIGLEWSMNKLFTDEFDNTSNPYYNDESPWSNKDWLSMAVFFISFDFSNRNSFCRVW